MGGIVFFVAMLFVFITVQANRAANEKRTRELIEQYRKEDEDSWHSQD